MGLQAQDLRRPQDLRPRVLYSRAELLAGGMHTRVLASDQMTRAVPGFYTRSDAPADLRAMAEVVQQHIRPGAVICEVTAAEIFGFPLPRDVSRAEGEPVHCRITGGGKSRAGRLVAVHTGAEAPVIRHHGLTISHPVTVLQEIAPRISYIDLVACVDAVATTRHGAAVPVPLAEIRHRASLLKGRGAAALRRAVVDARERVWSPMETKVRLMLLARGYPEPDLNLEIREPATGVVHYIDLAYPQRKIAIEYDGEIHQADSGQVAKDLAKNEALHALGWKVLRLAYADYLDSEDFFARLDAAIAERPRALPRPGVLLRPEFDDAGATHPSP